MESRNIRREALEKLAKLSAQSADEKTASPDLARLYKRCRHGSVSQNVSGETGSVSVAKTPMVRCSSCFALARPPLEACASLTLDSLTVSRKPLSWSQSSPYAKPLLLYRHQKLPLSFSLA